MEIDFQDNIKDKKLTNFLLNLHLHKYKDHQPIKWISSELKIIVQIIIPIWLQLKNGQFDHQNS